MLEVFVDFFKIFCQCIKLALVLVSVTHFLLGSHGPCPLL